MWLLHMQVLGVWRWVLKSMRRSGGPFVADSVEDLMSSGEKIMRNVNWPELVAVEQLGERKPGAKSVRLTPAFGPPQRRHNKSVGLRSSIC